jgi:tetratricopeptide (TPR) repeat protein
LDEETLRAGIVEFLSHLKSSDYEDPNCVAWRWLARGYEHTELTARVFLRDVRLWRTKEISDFEMIRRIDTEVVLTLTAMANKLPKLKAAGQWDEALQLVSKAESSSSDPDVWTAWKVGLLRDKGFLNQALEVALQWENQLRGRPVSPNRTRYGTQSALQQSYILLRLGRFAEAAASAQRALQWDARNKEALLYQALAYLYLRDENATQVALGQARKVEESIDWDLVEIALFRELKQWKRAEAVVAAAKKRYPSDGRLLYQETLLNLDQKKWKQAKLSYEALKDKDVDLAGRLAHLPVWKES